MVLLEAIMLDQLLPEVPGPDMSVVSKTRFCSSWLLCAKVAMESCRMGAQE